MRRRRKKGLKLSRTERDICLLYKKRFECDHDEESRRSLVRQFISKEFLTEAQKAYVHYLANKARKESKVARKPCEYYLYAIQCDDAVKIGYSSDPAKRLKSLQTSHPSTLHIAWKTFVGSMTKAKNMERKMHKHFASYHIRGEWFREDVLERLK